MQLKFTTTVEYFSVQVQQKRHADETEQLAVGALIKQQRMFAQIDMPVQYVNLFSHLTATQV